MPREDVDRPLLLRGVANAHEQNQVTLVHLSAITSIVRESQRVSWVDRSGAVGRQ
jgi:hypothetical protein